MKRLLSYAGCLLAIVAVSAVGSVAVAQTQSQNKPATPAEKFQALLRERQDAEDLSKVRTAEERKQVQASLAKHPLRFLELAEENPNDPVALEALIQTVSIVNGTAFPVGGKDSPGERALAQLRRDHIRSDKVVLLDFWLSFVTDVNGPVAPRAVAREKPERQALRPDRGPSQQQRR